MTPETPVFFVEYDEALFSKKDRPWRILHDDRLLIVAVYNADIKHKASKTLLYGKAHHPHESYNISQYFLGDNAKDTKTSPVLQYDNQRFLNVIIPAIGTILITR